MRVQRNFVFKEDHAIVLDYLPHGDYMRGIREPIVQALGWDFFTLLLLIPKTGVEIKPLEKVYIGSEFRPKIRSIIGKLKYDDLTTIAKDNLKKAIELIINENEKRFVDFFNNAGPINIRLHTLDLLPGIGKSTLKNLLEEREKEPFKSLEDIKKRVKGIGDPKKILIERIIAEIKGEDNIKLFAKNA